MKKIALLVSVLFGFTLLLSACGPKPDVTPPVVTIEEGNPSNEGGENFNFAVKATDDVSTSSDIKIRTRLDNGEWSEWGQDMAPSYDLSSITDGTHIFAVQAKDLAGNLSEVLYRDFNIDSISCLPSNLKHPISGTTLNTRAWEHWDGASRTYNTLTMVMSTTGQLIHTDPHNTTWQYMNRQEGWLVVMMSIGEAKPGNTIKGIVMVLSCIDGSGLFVSEEFINQSIAVNEMQATSIP